MSYSFHSSKGPVSRFEDDVGAERLGGVSMDVPTWGFYGGPRTMCVYGLVLAAPFRVDKPLGW